MQIQAMNTFIMIKYAQEFWVFCCHKQKLKVSH